LKQSQTGKAMIWNGSLDIFYKELSSTENYNLLFKPLILKTEQTQEQCNLPNIDLIDLDIQGLIIKSNPDKNELIKWLNNLIVFVKNYEKMDKQEDKEISLDE
jgi:regulatory protein YycH of two-component signal transduction system YycFG